MSDAMVRISPCARNLTGQRFGRLVVKSPTRTADGQLSWSCLCDCGRTVAVRPKNLTSGKAKSCRCTHRAIVDGADPQTHKRLHGIWRQMKNRCSNPRVYGYRRYGGRGIRVCDEWRESFAAFFEWAMANGYQERLTIDRRENDKDYEPSNCRWITQKANNRNKQNTPRLAAFGEVKSLDDWCEDSRCVVTKSTLANRVKYGWDAERCITEPPRHCYVSGDTPKQKVSAAQVAEIIAKRMAGVSLKEVSAAYGISITRVSQIVRRHKRRQAELFQ